MPSRRTAILLLLAASALPSCAEFDPANFLNGHSPYPVPSNAAVRATSAAAHGLTLLKVVRIFRHGSRYPVTTGLGYLKALEAWCSDLREADIPLPQYAEWLADWTSPYLMSDEGKLFLPTGEEDLRGLARRDVKRYRLKSYNSADVLSLVDAQSTKVQRSIDSGAAYLDQLTESLNGDFTPRLVVSKDKHDEFRPWSGCKKWSLTVLAPSLLKQQELESQRYKFIAAAFNQRLGIPDKYGLPTGLVYAAFQACGFERSLSGIKSRWCKLFTRKEFITYDGTEDEIYFRRHGPKSSISGDMMCPMVRWFGDALAPPTHVAQGAPPTIVARFGHAETIMHFGTLLGIWTKADKPTDTTDLDRPFRMARDLPFAANMHWELYTDDDDAVFVRLLINERVRSIPGCNGVNGFCAWETFRNILERKTAGKVCDISSVCSLVPKSLRKSLQALF